MISACEGGGWIEGTMGERNDFEGGMNKERDDNKQANKVTTSYQAAASGDIRNALCRSRALWSTYHRERSELSSERTTQRTTGMSRKGRTALGSLSLRVTPIG